MCMAKLTAGLISMPTSGRNTGGFPVDVLFTGVEGSVGTARGSRVDAAPAAEAMGLPPRTGDAPARSSRPPCSSRTEGRTV